MNLGSSTILTNSVLAVGSPIHANPWKLTLAAAMLLLLGTPLSGRAQTPETTLDSYLQQSVGDAESPALQP